MESPSLGLPTVNVGRRQEGRERADNIVDAPAEAEAILAAVARARGPAFRAGLAGLSNPYGDGRAAERIVELLESLELGQRLLRKPAPPAPERGF